VISTVLKVLVVLLLIRMVLRAVALWLRGPAASSSPGSPVRKTGAVQDLVRDQVCGTFVIREQAVRATIGGREELFCSAACRDKAGQARTIAS
jgi:hypothetical protein